MVQGTNEVSLSSRLSSRSSTQCEIIGLRPVIYGLKPVALKTHCFLFKMSAESVCNVCKESSHLKCGNCHGVSYCSKEHQKLDWKNHKSNCLCYKVVKNERLGRHLVAARVIAEGEIIIKESPLVCGPPQVTPPICLGCYKLLNEINAKACSSCGWPICSEICEKSGAHRPECEITSKHKNGKVKITTFGKDFSHPSYQCLTVLRCLYLKKARPKLWEKLMALESHCEERKTTIKYSSDQFFIAKFIPTFFNFKDFTEEEILKVAGIVQVNAHEIPLKEPGYIAIYEKASLLEHSCRANCMKSFTNSGELVIRAATKISPGDHLSICYTDPLWGKEMRMNHLSETKYFLCQCVRCSDPTEMGTHFNSLKCRNRECSGFCTPVPNPQNTDNKVVIEDHSGRLIWKCQKCGSSEPEEARTSFFSEMNDSFGELNKKSIKSCMEFIEKYEKFLHPNHYLLVSVKMALVDLFAWRDKLLSLETKDLEWTIKTCKEMYTLTTSLVPAENRLRGVLLYQLQFALTESGRRRVMGLGDASQRRENLMECMSILSKAYKLLSYEPDELPEGKMALEAKRILKNMEKYLLSSELDAI